MHFYIIKMCSHRPIMHRIALITYDISPYRGSEASVSWNFVTKMSRHVHLTVIYGRDGSEIDDYIVDHPLNNVDWIGIEKKDVGRFGRGLRQDYYYSLYYRQWHKEAAATVKDLVEESKIDLIHYLNPIGFKEPGWCWKIKSVPYVWGPVMAVENRPLKLFRAYTLKTKVTVLVRRVIHNSLFRFIPRIRKSFKASDTIFAATPNGKRMFKKIHNIDAEYLPENGIAKMERDTAVSLAKDEDLQIIWVGRVNDENKAIVILLDALLKTKSIKWHLHAIGEGSVRTNVKKRIAAIESNITWYGKIPRDQVQKIFMSSHLHVISSMGEATTTVIWEAMSKCIPTMTLDHCGMSGVVCDKCGIKIPIESYNKVTTRMADEIDRLITEPERVKKLSEGVIKCSKRFMWDNRINIFLDTYDRLILQYKDKDK